MTACSKCNKQIKSSDLKSCSKCNSAYHYQCLGVSQETFNKESKAYKGTWKCPECRSADKRGENSATPSQSDSQRTGVVSPVVGNIEDFKLYFERKLEDSLSRLLSDIRRDFSSESADTRAKIQELTESVNFISLKYDNLKEVLDDKSKAINDLQVENIALRSEVTSLNTRISQFEQQSRDCNLEIQCVPEHKAENLKTIVQQLAATVGCGLSERDLLNYHRVAKINQESNRPRSIVVKLASPLVRDSFLAAVKTFNKTHLNDKLNSAHLGIAYEGKPVYVCEHLTPENKQLHAAARKAAKDKKFEFVWVRGGKIHMRKDVNSRSFVVRNIDFLNTL